MFIIIALAAIVLLSVLPQPEANIALAVLLFYAIFQIPEVARFFG